MLSDNRRVRSSALWAGVDAWYFSISWKHRYVCHSTECLTLHFYLHDSKGPQRIETSTVLHEVCLAQLSLTLLCGSP